MGEGKIKLTCASIAGVFVFGDAILDYTIQIADMHEDEILGNRIETTEINTVAIIQNQLALRDLIRGSSSSSSGSIKAKKGKKVASVPITDSMYFSMDIKINSISNTAGWQSIFHCGNAGNIRLPGIWFHPDADNAGKYRQGFHIAFRDSAKSKQLDTQTAAVYGGKTYKLEIEYTQTRIIFSLDSIVVKSMAKPRHKTYASMPCYCSNPWNNAADVEVSNLVIKDRSAEGVAKASFVSAPQPNMVQFEMSISELAMKVVALVFVCLFIGFWVGKHSNSKNASYNPVKLIEEAGDQTDCEL